MELIRNWKITLYLVLLMTALNFFSHGTQDLYPTFLQKQHHFETHTVGILAAVMNVGAIVGGISFGICRRRSAASARSSLPACLRCRSSRCGPFRATPLLLGARRFLDPDRRAGGLGHHTGAPERAFAAARARPVPRLRLSARQSDRLQECTDPGRDRGEPTATIIRCRWRSSAESTAVIIAIWTALGPERKNADFVAEARAEPV